MDSPPSGKEGYPKDGVVGINKAYSFKSGKLIVLPTPTPKGYSTPSGSSVIGKNNFPEKVEAMLHDSYMCEVNINFLEAFIPNIK